MQQGEPKFGRGQFQIKVQPAVKLFFKYTKLFLDSQNIVCLWFGLSIVYIKHCRSPHLSVLVDNYIHQSEPLDPIFTQVLIELNKFLQNHCILIEQNVGILLEVWTNSNQRYGLIQMVFSVFSILTENRRVSLEQNISKRGFPKLKDCSVDKTQTQGMPSLYLLFDIF